VIDTPRIFLLALLLHAAAFFCEGQPISEPEIIVVHSGALQLRGLLWRPKGKGPFPAVLFNHGRGLTPQTEGRVEGITRLGNVFVKHGYIFMALFRRGEDLSADQGIFMGQLLERERAAKGDEAANRLQLRLMESDHLADALAGLAFLRAMPDVDRRRIAIVGHSFGGSLTMLIAEREKSVRAVVNFAAAAASWDGSAELRERLIAAVAQITAPVFHIYAENDFSVAPGIVLATEMKRRSKPYRLKLFPRFGKSPDEGHWFVYLGVPIWQHDVFSFLDKHMKN
jgi:carboxymethylenebutenolidase